MQVKLSQILSSLESGGRPKGGASLDNNGIPSLGAEHLDGNGGFNFKTIKYIPDDFFNGLKNGIVEKENILIVKDGATTGKVSFVTDEFPFDKAAVNEHVFLLKVDKSKANPKFVFHYLKCPQGQREIMRDFRGATVGGISRGFVDFVKFELPSLPDQLHIANLLSKAENLIAQRKESIRLLDEFLKSTFLEMFGDPVRNEKGWEIGKFKNLATLDRKQVLPAEFTKQDFYIGLEDIEKETGNIIKTSSENAEDLKSSKFRFTPNHILYAKLRPYLNKVALPNQSGICSTDIFPVLPLEGKSNRFFICYLMRSKPFVTEMHSKSSGANLPRASASVIENFKTYQPPIELQTQFAQIVEKIEALKTQYQQSLQELENLYGSLSQKAFRGELIKK